MKYSRYTGLDLHKLFIQATTMNRNGRVLKQWRFATTPEEIRKFAETLTERDAVALESTTNAIPVCLLLREHASLRRSMRSWCGNGRAGRRSRDEDGGWLER